MIAGLAFGFWLLETVKNRPSVLELGAEALDAANFPQTGEKETGGYYMLDTRGGLSGQVPYINQLVDYPTGCESVSAVMLLQAWGVDITVESFIDEYLPLGPVPEEGADGRIYGGDPSVVFLGSPYDGDAYGCYRPVIQKAMEKVLQDRGCSLTVQAPQVSSLSQVCDLTLEKGIPAVIWVTSGMRDFFQGQTWILPDGSEFTWTAPEHCVVLVGEDEKYYYVHDPQVGRMFLIGKRIAKGRLRLCPARCCIWRNSDSRVRQILEEGERNAPEFICRLWSLHGPLPDFDRLLWAAAGFFPGPGFLRRTYFPFSGRSGLYGIR